MQSISVLIKPVSSSCNMHCDYCFYEDVSRCREDFCMGKMSFNTIETIVKNAFVYAKDLVTFMFQGGEPTLIGLPFYKFFIECVKKYNINNINYQISLQTNAYALNDDYCKFFHDNNILVGVSLDGNKDTFDIYRHTKNKESAFLRVFENIERLKKHNVNFNILSVVTDESLKHFDSSYKFFLEHGFYYLQYISLIEDFNKKDNGPSLSQDGFKTFLFKSFDNFYNTLLNGEYVSIRHIDNYLSILMNNYAVSCNQVGHCSIQYVIEANGNVYPCDFYVLDEYLLGNIHTHTFAEMKANDIAHKFLDCSYVVANECSSCPYNFICRNGCRRDRVNGLNKYCKAYKEFFSCNLDKLKHALDILLNKR